MLHVYTIAKFILSITCARVQQVKVEQRAPRRKRHPRQGRLRAISELAAAASGRRAEGGVNDPDDFIECQPGVITIVRAIAIFFDGVTNTHIIKACAATDGRCSFRNICKIV